MNFKKYNNYLICIGIVFVSLISVLTLGQDERRFTYLGIENCRLCHDEKNFMNQYAIWLSSPHANAVKILTTDKGRKIGESAGIQKPGESIECLKCHTTGGGESELTKNEGVGCESCHGPGSGYSSIMNHVDLRSRKLGYVKAKKFGMYPILSYEDNLLKREKLCNSCHKKDRYCWPEDVEGIKRQKITIQVIDSLRKGDVKFYHSLRKN